MKPVVGGCDNPMPPCVGATLGVVAGVSVVKRGQADDDQPKTLLPWR